MYALIFLKAQVWSPSIKVLQKPLTVYQIKFKPAGGSFKVSHMTRPTFISCEEGIAKCHNTCIISAQTDFPPTNAFNCKNFVNFCVEITPNPERLTVLFLTSPDFNSYFYYLLDM